jgi:hypothetical protein
MVSPWTRPPEGARYGTAGALNFRQLAQRDDDLTPVFEGVSLHVKLVVDALQILGLVFVDFRYSQARNLAPRPRGIVSILKIFGGQHESSEKHSPSALHGTAGLCSRLLLIWLIEIGLFFGEIPIG